MNGRLLNDKAVEVQASSTKVLDQANDLLTRSRRRRTGRVGRLDHRRADSELSKTHRLLVVCSPPPVRWRSRKSIYSAPKRAIRRMEQHLMSAVLAL